DRGQTGRRPGGHQRIPELDSPTVVDEDLEPVLTGVAGPRHEGWNPGDRALGDGVVAEGAEIDIGQWRHDLDRARALDRDQRHRERAIVENRLEPGDSLGERVA